MPDDTELPLGAGLVVHPELDADATAGFRRRGLLKPVHPMQATGVPLRGNRGRHNSDKGVHA